MTSEPSGQDILPLAAFAAGQHVTVGTVKRWIRQKKLTNGLLPDQLIDVERAENQLANSLLGHPLAIDIATRRFEHQLRDALEHTLAAARRDGEGPLTLSFLDRVTELPQILAPILSAAHLEMQLFRASHFREFTKPVSQPRGCTEAVGEPLTTEDAGSTIFDLLMGRRVTIDDVHDPAIDEALAEMQACLEEQMALEYRRGKLTRRWAELLAVLSTPAPPRRASRKAMVIPFQQARRRD